MNLVITLRPTEAGYRVYQSATTIGYLIERVHGQKDFDGILACPSAIDQKMLAWPTLGRALDYLLDMASKKETINV